MHNFSSINSKKPVSQGRLIFQQNTKKSANPVSSIIFDFFRLPPTALLTINLWNEDQCEWCRFRSHCQDLTDYIWWHWWNRCFHKSMRRDSQWESRFFHNPPRMRESLLMLFSCRIQNSNLGLGLLKWTMQIFHSHYIYTDSQRYSPH